MKLPERYAPDDPREWLNRARSSLAIAKARVPGVLLEDLCFEAQQAAEKAIKTVMVLRRVAFPYIHDLARLLATLESDGQSIPEDVRAARRLTGYAVAARYPGIEDPVSEPQYLEAINNAEAVVRWAEERLLDEGLLPS